MAQGHGPSARNFKIPAFAIEPDRARLPRDERGREDGYLMARFFQFGGEVIDYLLDAANGAEALAYEQDTHNEDSVHGLHQRPGTLLPSSETGNEEQPVSPPGCARALQIGRCINAADRVRF